jgi:peptidyl-prolyl cis-trans isomerase C
LVIAAGGSVLSGCKSSATVVPTALPSLTHTPAIPTAVPSVTPTPLPQAARVNGEGILLSDYDEELQRFQMAQKDLGKDVSAADASKIVLDELIGEVLLGQAAAKAGFSVNDVMLDEHISQLAQNAGGKQGLDDWKKRFGYSDASFRVAERRQLLAAWMRDQLAAKVPTTAEQVHVRQILAYHKDSADGAYSQLQAGADFATLAKKFDPQTGGELGWFPRGYLTQKAVEDAAFALQPGQYSQVIETPIGFHIVEVIEREAQHPLAPDMRQMLARSTVADWIQQQRAASSIDILLPGS